MIAALRNFLFRPRPGVGPWQGVRCCQRCYDELSDAVWKTRVCAACGLGSGPGEILMPVVRSRRRIVYADGAVVWEWLTLDNVRSRGPKPRMVD